MLDARKRNSMQSKNRVLAGFAALTLSVGCVEQPISSDTLETVYQESIAAAAVKRPDFVRELRPVDLSKPTIRVAHLQTNTRIDTRNYDVWVTHPSELKTMCQG